MLFFPWQSDDIYNLLGGRANYWGFYIDIRGNSELTSQRREYESTILESNEGISIRRLHGVVFPEDADHITFQPPVG